MARVTGKTGNWDLDWGIDDGKHAKKEKEMEYVKVKKEDLIKVHKESCGDVKKVLEGLYPGEFEKVDVNKLDFSVANRGGGTFCLFIMYDGARIGTVNTDGFDTNSGVKIRKYKDYKTVLTLERE